MKTLKANKFNTKSVRNFTGKTHNNCNDDSQYMVYRINKYYHDYHKNRTKRDMEKLIKILSKAMEE